MIPRAPKAFIPIGRKLIGAVIIFEATAFGATYFFYTKANRDRDFRFELKEKFPWMLEKYYQYGELLKKENIAIRQTDQQVWATISQQPKEI